MLCLKLTVWFTSESIVVNTFLLETEKHLKANTSINAAIANSKNGNRLLWCNACTPITHHSPSTKENQEPTCTQLVLYYFDKWMNSVSVFYRNCLQINEFYSIVRRILELKFQTVAFVGVNDEEGLFFHFHSVCFSFTPTKNYSQKRQFKNYSHYGVKSINL